MKFLTLSKMNISFKYSFIVVARTCFVVVFLTPVKDVTEVEKLFSYGSQQERAVHLK